MLKPDGTRLFGEYTAAHVGDYFAITIDGSVLSAPVIQNGIPNGEVQITGGGQDGFSAETVSSLVTILRSGPLPFPVSLTASWVVGQPSPGPRSRARPPEPSGRKPHDGRRDRRDHPPAPEQLDHVLLADWSAEPDDRRAGTTPSRSKPDDLTPDARVPGATARQRWPEAEPDGPRERLARAVRVVDRQFEGVEADRPAEPCRLRRAVCPVDGRPFGGGLIVFDQERRLGRAERVGRGQSPADHRPVVPSPLARSRLAEARSARSETRQVAIEIVSGDRPRREPATRLQRPERRNPDP